MHFSAPDALERARRIRLMILDVDGVLTDGRLWYGPAGEELKAFHSFDGHGLKMLAESGVRCALLSGRRSAAVAKKIAVYVPCGTPIACLNSVSRSVPGSTPRRISVAPWLFPRLEIDRTVMGGAVERGMIATPSPPSWGTAFRVWI